MLHKHFTQVHKTQKSKFLYSAIGFCKFQNPKMQIAVEKRGVYWHCRQGRATTPDPDGRNTEHNDDETGGCRSQAVTADVTPANAGQAFGQYVPNIPCQV